MDKTTETQLNQIKDAMFAFIINACESKSTAKEMEVLPAVVKLWHELFT